MKTTLTKWYSIFFVVFLFLGSSMTMLVFGETDADAANKELIDDVIFSFSDKPYQLGGGPMDSAWPLYCHDLHHTSQSPYSTASNPGLEKWRFKCIGNTGHVNGGIIIGEDGTLYFGDSSAYLYALYPDGSMKWEYKTGGAISSTPALGEDGILYVGVWDDYLHAVDSTNGTRKWVFYANDANIDCAPTIAPDGTIYFGTLSSLGAGNKLYAVNPDGTEKWRFQTGSDIFSSPAIDNDGTIFFGSHDTYVYALYPNGTLKWKFKTGDYVMGSPSIATDETIYIGSYDGYLYALFPNGTLKWRCGIGYGTETNPAIGSDGTIYVGGQYLYAIYPNGNIKWSFDMGPGRSIHTSSPAISADGTIYIGTHIGDVSAGEIIAVNPEGTERWRKQIALDWVDSSPCIGEDGTVYIGSTYDTGKGYLHAFGPVESNSPPGTPTIAGTVNGTVREEYHYAFTSIDPDNNPVTCLIDWGDGSAVESQDFASSENGWAGHTYTKRGTYTIKAKARDTLGEESDWGTLTVTMPTSYNQPLLQFLELLFQRFPNAFLLLRYLLGFNQ